LFPVLNLPFSVKLKHWVALSKFLDSDDEYKIRILTWSTPLFEGFDVSGDEMGLLVRGNNFGINLELLIVF